MALTHAVIAGAFAVGYAFVGFRHNFWLLFILVPSHIGTIMLAGRTWQRIPRLTSSAADHAALLARVRSEGLLAMTLVIIGYVLMVAFVRREGIRVFGPMTEIRLASEVHRALVPGFSRSIGEYEIYGASVPAGQVGGDLVDLIEASGGGRPMSPTSPAMASLRA